MSESFFFQGDNVELYTSLTRLKMAMNGGRMPAMTPLSDRALEYFDPSFTPGMGALEEDHEKGLRCPVKDCGRYFHLLGRHLNRSHRGIGGRVGVLTALSIPLSAVTASRAIRDKHSESMRCRWANGQHLRTVRIDAKSRAKASATRIADHQTIGRLNLADQCVAQLSHKMIDLQHSLGREPTHSDILRVYGGEFIKAAQRVFGSWSNLKAHVGMRVQKNGITKDQVYDSLKAYWDEYGRLPSAETANKVRATPMLPARRVILRVLGVASWTLAMQQAAFVLGLDDKRYGLNGSVGKSYNSVRGEAHGSAKLLEAQVIEILSSHGSNGETARTLALRMGVSISCVKMIVQRKNWRHLRLETAKAG